MGKTVTSARRKIVLNKPKKEPKTKPSETNEPVLNLEDFEGIGEEHNPSDYLTNDKNLGNAIIECLENNDPEGVMEVIAIYLEAVNKTKLSQKNKLHRQTMYSALKHRNPTIKTLSKIVHELTR
jgi:DNA-binding phage protein